MENQNPVASKVAVIGVGRIGAVTAVGMAHLLHSVTGIDTSRERLARLAAGELPESEPGLRAALRSALRLRDIRFTSTAPEGTFDAAFLCVDTPPLAGGEPDLSQVFEAARQAARLLVPGGLLITRSTMPPGSTARLKAGMATLGRTDIHVAHVPEFLREGSAWEDFREPDRLVIGADTSEAAQRVRALFNGINSRVFITSRITAELSKYAANAFLATSVSFANEISDLGSTIGADTSALFEILRSDPRIGKQAYLGPGLGFGGHCLPKDTAALEYVAAVHGHQMQQLRATIQVNRGRVPAAVAWLRETLGTFDGRRIAIAGLAFKPGTDDLRDSPALRLASALAAEGATLHGFDPNATPVQSYLTPEISLEAATTGADALIVSYRTPVVTDGHATQLAREMRSRVLFDAAGYLHADEWRQAGFIVNRTCLAAPVLSAGRLH